MREIVKKLRLQSPRFVRSPLALALSSMLLVLLTPAQPLEKETRCGTGQIDGAGVARLHETFKVYFILMSHGMDLTKSSVWSTAETILEQSQKRSLDPMLIIALIHVESRFRHNAVSTEGARGLMQILSSVGPALAKEADIENWRGTESLHDPILNIKLGIFYLSEMKKRFRDLRLALSAYNLGPTKVQKRLEEGEVIPFGYARKVLAVHRLYQKKHSSTPTIFPGSRDKLEASL